MKYSDIDFNTGDLILFQDNNRNTWLDYLSYLIQYFTDSKYSHVGMVVKDPLIKGKTMEGLYFLESTGLDNMIDVVVFATKGEININKKNYKQKIFSYFLLVLNFLINKMKKFK